MRRFWVSLFTCFSILVISSCAQQRELPAPFPDDFKQLAFEHIDSLAKLGPRTPGSEAEEEAITYIRNQFQSLDLDVRVEPFEFESFEIKQVDFRVCGQPATAQSIGFNPYRENFSYKGEAVFIGPDIAAAELSQMNLKNRIVITTEPVFYFSLIYKNPQAIVYLDGDEYSDLAASECLSCNLLVHGMIEKHRSANIIAELGSSSPLSKEIIISAHFDSYRQSPGADDNGSGVGVLIELARYFAEVREELGGVRLKFIAFGAEELGVLGSRIYLNTHKQELQECLFVFNMDQVGGPEGPYIEMLEGVQGIPETKGANQFPAYLQNRAWEGVNGQWRLLDAGMVEIFTVSNRPEWLRTLIAESAKELGYHFTPRGNMGSDQQVFAQAGIVATGIGTSGNQYHSPQDTPDQVDVDQLEVVGKIVATSVYRVMQSDGIP